jgi:hypothetical protein
MSIALRTWLAALGLAISALVLTADADPQTLGARALVCLVVLFSHGWIVAVGERACPQRGGVDIPRFPLGPRLLTVRPGLLAQCLVPVMMLGVVTRNTLVLGVGVAIVLIVTTDVLRQSMVFVLPILGLVYALLSMDEFHTLGDLLTSAEGWVSGLMTLAIWALVLSGSLLRTDVAGTRPKAQLISFLAATPGYAGAFFLLSRTQLAGIAPDLLGLGVVLLAGGVVQTIVVGLLGGAAEIKSRSEADFPRVNPASVGMAMMPMLLPVVGCLAMLVVAMGPVPGVSATRAEWVSLMALLLIVPAIPAVGLVAAALDRLDGKPYRYARVASLSTLAVWFVIGPMALSVLYAPTGPVAAMAALFPIAGGWQPVVAQVGGTSAVLGSALGGELLLFGLPAADLCRAATLMVALPALLAAAFVRHAACGLKGTNWGTVIITLGLTVVGVVLLQPRMGPAGAACATAAAALIMFLVDGRAGEEQEEEASQSQLDALFEMEDGEQLLELDEASEVSGVSIDLDESQEAEVLPPEVVLDLEGVSLSETPEVMVTIDGEPQPEGFDLPDHGEPQMLDEEPDDEPQGIRL